MRDYVVAMAIASLICGLISSWYWYRATKILFTPEISNLTVDSPQTDFTWAFLRAIMIAVTSASRLNRWAALWTAATVVLGCASNLLGAVASN